MTIRTITAEPLDESAGPRTVLGESARWDGSAWWWVDADPGHVWTRVPGGPAELVVGNGGRTSLVHPDGTGAALIVQGSTLLAARRHDQHWRLTPYGSVQVPEGWLVNDGTADAAGRLWIGSIEPTRAAGAGELIRVDQDGSNTRQACGITLSNGLVWSADGTVLFHADTFGHRILRHRVTPDGSVIASETAIAFTDDGLPDGLAADREGGIWVAMYDAGEVRRYTADGTLDTVITIPTPQATSVELGGPDGHDVLITSAREGFTAEQSAADPTFKKVADSYLAFRKVYKTWGDAQALKATYLSK